MATNYRFSLGGSAFDVSVEDSNASVNGSSVKVGADGSFSFNGGSFVTVGNSEYKFVANGGHGEFKFDSTTSTIEALDFSKAYAAVSFVDTNSDGVISIVGSNYADKVTVDNATYVDLGAGNDSVVLAGNVTNGGKVTLGAGADTVLVKAGADNVTITDYKFTDGDVIASVGQAAADAEVLDMASGNASLKVGGATVIVAEDDNNVYAMKMKVGANASLDANYYLGQKDKDVVLDLSAVKASTTVNFASVKSAEVVMGRGVDSLTLNGKGNNLVTLTANTSSVADVIDSIVAVLAVVGPEYNTLGIVSSHQRVADRGVGNTSQGNETSISSSQRYSVNIVETNASLIAQLCSIVYKNGINTILRISSLISSNSHNRSSRINIVVYNSAIQVEIIILFTSTIFCNYIIQAYVYILAICKSDTSIIRTS